MENQIDSLLMPWNNYSIFIEIVFIPKIRVMLCGRAI